MGPDALRGARDHRGAAHRGRLLPGAGWLSHRPKLAVAPTLPSGAVRGPGRRRCPDRAIPVARGPCAAVVAGGGAAAGGGAGLVPLLVLTVGSVLTGVYYARPRTTSFLMPFFAIMLALGLSRVAARGRASAWLLGVAVGLVVTLNLLALRFSLADTRYVPFNWAGAARLVQENWRSDDALVFYPVPARIAFSYYFPGAAVNAVTIVPPAIPGLSTEWLANRGPPGVAFVQGAPRGWVVLTGPTPPGAGGLLLGGLGRAYRRQNVTDFGRVWVFLYATRAGEGECLSPRIPRNASSTSSASSGASASRSNWW